MSVRATRTESGPRRAASSSVLGRVVSQPGLTETWFVGLGVVVPGGRYSTYSSDRPRLSASSLEVGSRPELSTTGSGFRRGNGTGSDNRGYVRAADSGRICARGVTLVPTAMSIASRSSTIGDDGGPRGRIDTDCCSAWGRKVYDLSEELQVRAWIELRNRAARARRNEFTADEIRLMIQGLRDFMIRHPA